MICDRFFYLEMETRFDKKVQSKSLSVNICLDFELHFQIMMFCENHNVLKFVTADTSKQ